MMNDYQKLKIRNSLILDIHTELRVTCKIVQLN